MSDASGEIGIRIIAPCRLWTGPTWPNGYGMTETCGIASREVYEDVIGPIPDGHDVLHYCDNPPCVEPMHLFTGTPRDNILDCIAKGRAGGWAKNAYKTHCLRGHPFDQANTYWYVNVRGNWARACRTCKRTSGRLRQRRLNGCLNPRVTDGDF